MGFFDETAKKLGVPEGGGGLIKEDDGGKVLESSIEDAYSQIQSFDEQMSQQLKADAPELGSIQPPATAAPPPPAAAPPAAAAPPPPPPASDPALLQMLQQNTKVVQQLAESQQLVRDRVSKQQEEADQRAEMQALGLDPSDPAQIRDYFLSKELEKVNKRLEEANSFQQQLQQQARAYATQQQVQAGLRAKAPHLTEQQAAFYAQRAAQEAIQTGQPVEAVVATYAAHLAPPPPSPQAPAAPQPAALPQLDPAAFMQLLAQANGMGAPQTPSSGKQDVLAAAEKLFFGGR